MEEAELLEYSILLFLISLFNANVLSISIADVPHVTEPEDLYLLQYMTIQQTIVASAISVDIVSYIPHARFPRRLLAATENHLLDITPNGACRVIAGTQLDGCEYTENHRTFSKISHISNANLTQTSFSIEFAVLVADQGEYCVKVIDLKHLGQETINFIGICGTKKRNPQNSRIALQYITLRKPIFLSVIYFSTVVRVTISCAQVGGLYPVIVNFYQESVYGYEYDALGTAGYVTGINPFVTTPRLLNDVETGDDECSIAQFAQAADTYKDYLCTKKYTYFVPVDFLGHPIVVYSRGLNLIKLIGSQMTFEPLIISLVPTDVKLDQVVVSATGNGIITFDQSSKSFHFIGLGNLPGDVKRITQFKMGYTVDGCGGTPIFSGNSHSLESCSYRCVKHSMCAAFSFNLQLNECSLYSTLSTAIEQHTSTNCYHPIP